MGIFDSAVLMALARKFAPAICVETGGNLGMSSSFILQGMHEAGIEAALDLLRSELVHQLWVRHGLVFGCSGAAGPLAQSGS